MTAGGDFRRRVAERAEASRAARHVRWDADIEANRRAAPGTEFPVLVDAADVEPIRLVYGLADPRDQKRIRYVGQTATGAFARYLGHLADAGIGASGKAQWLERLRGEGVHPTMVLLELVAPNANILSIESWWIRSLKERGEADLNAARNSHRKAAPIRGGFPDLTVASTRDRPAPCHALDPRHHQRPRAFALLALLVVVGGGVGCGPTASVGGASVAGEASDPMEGIGIHEDTARGVVCYRTYYNGRVALSCVKVRP